jgi:DNA-binding IclR family transcriptional regulator
MPRTATKNGTPEEVHAYSVPALEKGLDVLELLSNAHQALGLNEIAAALGRSRQELFRVVLCLQTRGYLLRDAAGQYRLGSRMFEVGSRHLTRQSLVTLAMPRMEELAATAGESCQLAVLEPDRLLIIATAVGSAFLQLGVKVGTSIPLHCSVIGLLAMAFARRESRDDIWKRRRELLRKREDVMFAEITTEQAWNERLDAIHKQGSLSAHSPMHPGTQVNAAPVTNAEGNLTAVLSLTRIIPIREPARRTNDMVAALVAAAQSISVGFGAADG